jgi:hypothetical protein
MHSHHLCIDPHAILVVGVEVLWELNQGQWRLRIRVKVLLERVLPEVDIELIRVHHGAYNASRSKFHSGICTGLLQLMREEVRGSFHEGNAII